MFVQKNIVGTASSDEMYSKETFSPLANIGPSNAGHLTLAGTDSGAVGTVVFANRSQRALTLPGPLIEKFDKQSMIPFEGSLQHYNTI